MPTGQLREEVIVTRQSVDSHALPAGPGRLSLAAGDGKIKQRPIVGPFQHPVQPSPQDRFFQHPLIDLRQHQGSNY
jgi:hypothetical protein